MYMTIKSRKLNREFRFSVPGQSYIFVDLDGKPGSQGVQICEGGRISGRISGNTLCYYGDDQMEFERICRNWYKAAMNRGNVL